MSETEAGLRHQLNNAKDLQAVVRTMKALAASSIGDYEKSVLALTDYYHSVELGLGACFRELAKGRRPMKSHAKKPHERGPITAIVFGSDQGLVGQFNEVIGDFTIQALAATPGPHSVWVVGERVHARLLDAGVKVEGSFAVPGSVNGISSLIGEIQMKSKILSQKGDGQSVEVFHNRPQSAAQYEPARQQLLPLDEKWQNNLIQSAWPTALLPEVVGPPGVAFRGLLRESLFITLFRACAESLASENASRLAAMQRADRNIQDLLEELHGTSRRLRQTSIDSELFDVISGFEALSD